MIRSARTSDAEALGALESEAFGSDAWSQAQIEAELVGATRQAVVAEAEGQIVGYAAISIAGDVADLTRIVVAEPHRRSGVASALMAALHEGASRAGAERILLEVAESNRPARELYQSHGYAEISRRPAYYAGAGDALVLGRALG